MIKKLIKPSLSSLLVCLALTTACSSPEAAPTPTPDIGLMETIIAATMAAPASPTATQAPAASDTPTPSAPPETPPPSATPTQAPTPTAAVASVSGKLCYRTSQVPAMTAYFQETETKLVVEQAIAAGQITYTVSLPPGKYIAYAWLPDFSLGGLYSKAATCSQAACSDHTPIPFTVAAGEKISGVNICDWYAFSIPLPPGKSEDQATGSISGRVDYPGGSAPPLHVVAFNRNTSYWYFVLILENQSNFTLQDLPPGVYVVAAYTREGQAGGYVEGGELKSIIVKAGETAFVEISGWGLPGGTFPEDPSSWETSAQIRSQRR